MGTARCPYGQPSSTPLIASQSDSEKARSLNLPETDRRARSPIRRRRSSASCSKSRETIEAAYSSSEAASSPTSPRGTTMSSRGPPDACATGGMPAAISSTTPMPKCSFHMV
eukprot:scaffold150295_cov31-Tisochrysis_lutea.AAC.1